MLLGLALLIAGCGGGGSSFSSNPGSDNANLSDLSINPGELDQIFQPSQTAYTATVDFLVASVEVTTTSEDPNATLTVNGSSVASGTPYPVDLAEGVNPVIVEVTAEDGATTKTYTIDITRETAASFAQEAYLKASDTNAIDFDAFGTVVALSGDTLAVGAPFEDSNATGVNGDDTDNSARAAGAVYVFTRDVGGVWSQQAYIKASNTDANDFFGASVALSGDTLAVGAYAEASNATGVNGNEADNSAPFAGAVYVFTRDPGGVWSQQAYLKASNTDPSDQFGISLAISGDTLAVGADFEDSNATGVNGNQTDNSAAAAGAVYVFTRDAGGVWTQQAYVKASNTEELDFFGSSVTLSRDTLVTSSLGEDSNATGVNGDETDNSAPFSGAAYVFTRDAGGAWTQQAYLKASNTDASDQFGFSVALAGDTLAVGAVDESSNATGVDGDQTDNSVPNAGAVYVFTRDTGGAWSQQAYLKASNTDANDFFGTSVALSGDTLAVGADGESSNATGVNGNETDNSSIDAGAVYVFARDASGAWSQQAYVKASNTDPDDGFGWSVTLDGDILGAGSPGESSNATGVNGDETDNSSPAAGAAYALR
jgi:hypothetical protein